MSGYGVNQELVPEKALNPSSRFAELWTTWPEDRPV